MKTHKAAGRPFEPVLILDGHSQVLSIARRLPRYGIRVEASTVSDCPSYASRFCNRRYAFPKNIDPKEFWFDLLLSREDENLIGSVLLAGGDQAVEFLCEHREELARKYLMYDFHRVTHLAFLDKEQTLKLAKKAGIPVPKFWSSAEAADVERIIPTLSFPVIVKPRSSYRFQRKFIGRKYFFAQGVDDLVRYLKEVNAKGVECILSEFIPGPDSLSRFYATYRDGEGRPLFEFIRKIVRRRPVNEGAATYHISEWDPEIAGLGRKLLDSVGFTGFASVEFKRDLRDGSFKLMEVNPRFEMSHECMEQSGIDAAYIIYCDITGRPAPKFEGFRDDTRLVNLALDFLAFCELRKRGEMTFWNWLKSLSFRQHYEYFALDDPMPALVFLSNRFKSKVAKRRMVARKRPIAKKKAS